MVQPISFSASALVPSTSLKGDEPPTIFRGENLKIVGGDGRSRFEAYQGHLDLGENYDIDTAPTKQVETATVVAAAGITGDGYATITITLRGATYVVRVSLTAATHTTASLIAAAIRTALSADPYISQKYTVGGSGATYSLSPVEAETNDATLNLAHANGTCTGITAAPTSTNTTTGVAGFRLTGTIAFTSGSRAVTGTSTEFTKELGGGQKFIAGAEVFAVTRVVSDTSLIVERAPTTTLSGQTARRLPILQEIDKKRAVFRRGSISLGDRKDINGAGNGELYINGVSTGFSLSRRPRRFERDSSGAYTQKSRGFPDGVVPNAPTITVGAGGTKGMQAGNYSFMVSFWNSVTKGFSNPCPVIKKDGAAVDIIITAGQRFTFDFTESRVEMPDNADGFIIWQSLSGGGVTAVNTQNFNQGPWYKAKELLLTELDGSDQIFHEALDAELGVVVSGDNDQPPECEFLTEFANVDFFISAFGGRKTSNPDGSNPGNYVVPAKPSNPEAAPAGWRVGVADEITGFALGVGRLFTLTPNGLPFVTPTGRTEIARLLPTLLDIPFTSRPYWTKGSTSPHNIVVVQGEVFLMSGGKPVRSPSGADENNVVPFEIGEVMQDLMQGIPDGHYILCPDPKNQQLCFIASGVEKNTDGYWISRIFPLDLKLNRWMPVIPITNTSRDMIVSGAAVVDNRMEFLAGGRVAGGTYSVGTFRYDEPSGTAIPYYGVFQPSDFGHDSRAKLIKSIKPRGRLTSFNVQIHGTTWDETLTIDWLEDGVNSVSGNISFSNSTSIKEYLKKKVLVKNLILWCLRFSGTYDGSEPTDRLDEIVVEVDVHGGSQ